MLFLRKDDATWKKITHVAAVYGRLMPAVQWFVLLIGALSYMTGM